ncbi:Tryptophanase [Frankliniella fusca]|uniref:Tryptophanase n=1 Tax=Frankliniella fusca TaxID=407009 RepID=A0AAE1LKP7_9NEOP|nr:Tryptophanase [Frankliniella fusca]
MTWTRWGASPNSSQWSSGQRDGFAAKKFGFNSSSGKCSLTHLERSVENFAQPFTHSAFVYESFNGEIKNTVKSSNVIPQQICKLIQLKVALRTMKNDPWCAMKACAIYRAYSQLRKDAVPCKFGEDAADEPAPTPLPELPPRPALVVATIPGPVPGSPSTPRAPRTPKNSSNSESAEPCPSLPTRFVHPHASVAEQFRRGEPDNQPSHGLTSVQYTLPHSLLRGRVTYVSWFENFITVMVQKIQQSYESNPVVMIPDFTSRLVVSKMSSGSRLIMEVPQDVRNEDAGEHALQGDAAPVVVLEPPTEEAIH